MRCCFIKDNIEYNFVAISHYSLPVKQAEAYPLTNIYKMKNNKRETSSAFIISAGKGLLIVLTLLGLSLAASAQKATVAATLSKHGIDEAVLTPANFKAPDDRAYDLKQTTTTAGKAKTITARFDPSSTEKWTVVSVDGKAPSNGDTKSFREGRAKQSASKTDDASYKVEQETADQLTYSYKMDAASLPKDAAAVKDCRMFMTINLKTKQPEQLKVVNEKPIKVGIMKADKFEITSKYTAGEANRYFPVSDVLDIQAKFMGQPVNVQTVTEYSNYAKK